MSDETKKVDIPGMLAIRDNTSKQIFPHTIDAREWAKEFYKCGWRAGREGGGLEKDQIDLMTAWFANAIMAGYDTASMRMIERRKR